MVRGRGVVRGGGVVRGRGAGWKVGDLNAWDVEVVMEVVREWREMVCAWGWREMLCAWEWCWMEGGGFECLGCGGDDVGCVGGCYGW